MIKWFVNIFTGEVRSASGGSAVTTLRAKVGRLFVLVVVPHDDVAAVRLEGAVPVFVIKKKDALGGVPLFALTSWTAGDAATDGYMFRGRLAGAALKTAVEADEDLVAEVVWTVPGEDPAGSMTVAAALQLPVWQDDEPALDDPDPPYPLPGEIVTEAPGDGKLYVRKDGGWVEIDPSAGGGEMVVPTFRRLVAPDGGIWRETISNAGVPVWAPEIEEE